MIIILLHVGARERRNAVTVAVMQRKTTRGVNVEAHILGPKMQSFHVMLHLHALSGMIVLG